RCCASHTWPMVGNSNSPMTTVLRSEKSSAVATLLMAAETLVTMATSSGSALIISRIPRGQFRTARSMCPRESRRYSSFPAAPESRTAHCPRALPESNCSGKRAGERWESGRGWRQLLSWIAFQLLDSSAPARQGVSLEWARVSTGQLQDLFVGNVNVLQHVLARQFRISFADGLHDLGVLPGRRFAVIVNVDGGVHDAFHLCTHIHNCTDQKLVAGKLGDTHVELSVRLDEAGVAGAVILNKGNVELLQFIQDGRIARLASCQLRACSFQGGAVLVEIIEFSDRDMANEIAAIRNDAEQVFVLQTYGSFPHRRAAAAVHFGQQLLT